MYTLDDLMENRDAQITLACIAFFVLAFPAYFYVAAGNADGTLSGGVGDWQVNGELTYVLFDSGTESIASGDTWTATFNTDAVDIDGLNVVGIRIVMEYGEDESGGDGPACPGGSAAPDTITATATHMNYTQTEAGQNDGGFGTHEARAVWFDESLVGRIALNTSVAEIEENLNFGAGPGDHNVSITVDADAGNEPVPSPLCTRDDGGETVDYRVELIVFDATIAPYIDVSDL